MTAHLTILPDPEQLRLIHLMATTTEITAVVETSAVSVHCPCCNRLSRRVHSRYGRSVADVPWHGVPFRLRLHVRRFFCDEPTCPRTIFAERLPGLAWSCGALCSTNGATRRVGAHRGLRLGR